MCHSSSSSPPSLLLLSLLAFFPLVLSQHLNAAEICTTYFQNDSAWYIPRIPIFQSSDTQLTDVYYYRWGIFRTHQRDLGPLGYISTEFIDDVGWELLPFASLNDATGFHLGEGRWSRDRRFAHDYVDFMYTYHDETSTYGNDRHFSEAIADAAWRVYLVDGDLDAISQHLDAMKTIYEQWYDHFDYSKGLYWVEPLADATEYTISSIDASGGLDGFTGGQAFRPSINSYMYANARAIANLASLSGDSATEELYTTRAEAIQANFTTSLWNSTFEHFIDRYNVTNEYVKYWDFIRGRELVGLVPWMFGIVPTSSDVDFSVAWTHALDTDELRSAYGLRTVEPSYEYYMRQYRYDSVSGRRECQWNGPIWPFQTTQALSGMANLLDQYDQDVVTNADYVDLLRLYAQLHYDDGAPNIEEDYYPDNGTVLVGLARSPHYFHSGFIDLVLSGLVGIRPRQDDYLEVNPLVDDTISWFRVENVPYHGHDVSVQWDADGTHFNTKGLIVEVDGRQANSSATLTRLVTAIAPAEPPAIDRPIAKSIQLQDNTAYPFGNASVAGADAEQIHDVIDGRVWFWSEIVNGYDSAVGDGVTSQWFSVDFGSGTEVSRAEIAFYEGGQPGMYTYANGTYTSASGTFAAPASYFIEVLDDNGGWANVSASSRWTNLSTFSADEPVANGITNVKWGSLTTEAVRLVFVPQAGTQVRLVEFKVF
ncbi:Beta-L-arabinobiosidase [Cytospora mali]|uniref:Beta-L-arabinobiosidase n=1 Tax=Cytospora mali TaxID=578113 RepID=A0A194VK67_CYTMA|nr:Beta-L-arabinobiosidase [Valsa mali]